MAYTPYATLEDYLNLELEEFEGIDDALRTASRHIDSLTFNRIVAAGFENLTLFQQELIKEIACRQALFEHTYADLINTVLSSYSINGVSMGFGTDTWNLTVENGVAMPKDLYSFLKQTGLCCRVL